MLISLFKRLKLRLSDMGTIIRLSLGALRYAHRSGEESYGAEHLLLSAFDLPDGTVCRVFERIGKSQAEIDQAIKKQYQQALSDIGIDTSHIDLDINTQEPRPKRKLHEAKPSAPTIMNLLAEMQKTDKIPPLGLEAKPSAQTLMRKLSDLRKTDKDIPLLGIHVLEALSVLPPCAISCSWLRESAGCMSAGPR